MRDDLLDELYSLQLSFKCPMTWKSMDGDERVRFCEKCKQNVYNIAQLNRDEALDLISKNEGGLCIRIYRRRDGKIVTRDCLSILGTNSLREKYNWLAWLNFHVSAFLLAILPILGPSFITIENGNSPKMQEPVEATVPEVSGKSEPALGVGADEH
ncbi:MAG: hypothetical protein K2Y32_01865 [Candidatus Obscuribacterales bacterium]|nr:hypothetical protein [Candidatus Obscuribacterales bacterium]